MKCWEIIADNLKKAGFSLGWVSAIDPQGRTIWIVDAHGYEKRFIVRADEILTAFLELKRAIHEFAVDLMKQGSYSLPRKGNSISGCAIVTATVNDGGRSDSGDSAATRVSNKALDIFDTL